MCHCAQPLYAGFKTVFRSLTVGLWLSLHILCFFPACLAFAVCCKAAGGGLFCSSRISPFLSLSPLSEIRSCYVAVAIWGLSVLLPHPPECWDTNILLCLSWTQNSLHLNWVEFMGPLVIAGSGPSPPGFYKVRINCSKAVNSSANLDLNVRGVSYGFPLPTKWL